MELVIDAHALGWRRLVTSFDEVVEQLKLLGGNPLRRQTSRAKLQRLANMMYVGDVAGHVYDFDTGRFMLADETIAYQTRDGLANRCAADTQGLGNLDLAQTRA